MIWLVLLIIAVVIVCSLFANKSDKYEDLSPQEKKMYDELNKIHKETGITDYQKLYGLKLEKEEKALDLKNLNDLAKNRIKIDADNAQFIHSIELKVAGIYYRTEEAKDEAKYLDCGELVSLRKDLNNEYDPYAVKVISNRKHIGFVPSSDSQEISEYMDDYKYKAVVLHSFQVFNNQFSDYETCLIVKVYFFSK